MQMTLTEKRLVKMWTATSYGGDWYELNKTLWEIAKVLEAEGMETGAELFTFLSSIALQRAVDETQARKMKVCGSSFQDAVARGETLNSVVNNLIGSAT